MGETGIFSELCSPLCLWGGIHPAPVSANPPLEELYPQGGPHLFPSPLLPHFEKKIISLPLPVVTQNSWHFKCFFSWRFEFCASGVPRWEMDRRFHAADPLCVSRPCTDWWWGCLGRGKKGWMSRTCEHPNPPPASSLLSLWGWFCQHTPALCSTDVVALSGAPKLGSAQLGASTH